MQTEMCKSTHRYCTQRHTHPLAFLNLSSENKQMGKKKKKDIGVDQRAIIFYISGFSKFRLLCSSSAITLTCIFFLFLSVYLSFSYCISAGPASSSVQLKSALLADPSLVYWHSSKALFVTAYIVCMWCKLCVSLSNLVS